MSIINVMTSQYFRFDCKEFAFRIAFHIFSGSLDILYKIRLLFSNLSNTILLPVCMLIRNPYKSTVKNIPLDFLYIEKYMQLNFSLSKTTSSCSPLFFGEIQFLFSSCSIWKRATK